MNEYKRIMQRYPIGTMVRMKDDYPYCVREVYGYEILLDSFNLIFRDGTKLNSCRIGLIEEVA